MNPDAARATTDNDKLFTLAYEELRRLAAAVTRSRTGAHAQSNGTRERSMDQDGVVSRC